MVCRLRLSAALSRKRQLFFDISSRNPLMQLKRFIHCCSCLLLLTAFATAGRADLVEYVKKPDAAFSWKIKQKKEVADGVIYDLHLVSQVWQGITWEHELQVFLPKGVEPTATMFLWNQGGKSSPTSILMGMELARKMKAPVAFLYGIPNQPLFDGKKEDALIAETFVRYLETKDPSWPLLFPMVKSLTRAMDALQQFAKQEWKIEVTHFVVSGGSKRGWTTWLTAAADARVKALAPCVFDTLNMQAQMPHQLKSYGKYSEMITDYTKRGLIPMPNTDDARKLWMMVDPWAYRKKITQPTMIVNGTNDPYWTQDALNLYWDDLKGDKWVLYVPNAGHTLAQKHDVPTLLPDLSRAFGTLAAFSSHQIHGTPMPKIRWKHEGAGPKLQLKVEADPAPKAVRLWSTQAATRDFRKSKWVDRQLAKGKSMEAEVETPANGFVAFFAELEYEMDGYSYFLSTQLRIAGKE
jgi:PhoPQ-activated pathogenicity-related protein